MIPVSGNRGPLAVATALLCVAVAVQASAAPGAVAAADARRFVEGIGPSARLQEVLDRAWEETVATDPAFARSSPRVAVVELPVGSPPRLAQRNGEVPVYPASVVKFVYLMAAYRWQRDGRLRIDPAFDAELTRMIHDSSNAATQKVFARLTGTEPGPELPGDLYADYRRRRLLVKDWLQSMGIDDLHAVSPTYDGGGDLFGRDRQFLRDRTVPGALPASSGEFRNRQAMTASGSARLLALLAAGVALGEQDSGAVLERMRRDVREQPYLARRIAGGAAAVPGAVAYSKSGTWGPIYADAGVVRHRSGRQFSIAVFTDASPAYRGDAIAGLTRRVSEELFREPTGPQGEPS